MLRNWLLLSFRRFRRGTGHALINIFGLTLGLFVFLLISLYVFHEFSYDNFHTNGERIYRLAKENKTNIYLGSGQFAVHPAPLYDVIADMSDVENVSRFSKWGQVVIESNAETFYEDRYFAADSGLLRMLTFEPVAGRVEQGLDLPHSVIISENTAVKIFGTANAVGQTIKLTSFVDLGEYTVQAVFKDFPSNSSFQFNIIVRFLDAVKASQPGDLQSWGNSNYNFLVMLKPGADPRNLESQLDEQFYKRFAGTDEEESAKATHHIAQALPDLYLGPVVNFDFAPRNDVNRLYLLAIIAVFVLVVAAINYINLTTARALSRAKEVAVRKVSGAEQLNLMYQFLGDSVLVTSLATLLALGLTWSFFPIFRDFIGKPISGDALQSPTFLIGVISLGVVVGILAGAYPAFALSSFKPAAVLKGTFNRSGQGIMMRNVLSVLQFSISSGLIIAVAVITGQLAFIENNDPGYQREHIIYVPLSDAGVREKRQYFKQQLDQHPNIEITSLATYMPNSVRTQQSRKWKSAQGEFDVAFYTIHADEQYIDLFGIQILEGRNFSPGNPADRNAFLINETAVQTYGWENPVGMRFTGEGTAGQPGDTAVIIGVFRDLHFESYRAPIAPLRIGASQRWISTIALKVKPHDLETTLAFIEKTYQSLATTKVPYAVRFFDEQFTNAYKSDLQLSKLITIFSFIAILIACMGLYALSTHTLAQQTKELSIRKILGAEVAQIVYLVVSKFMVLIIVSFVIASPVAYFVMSEWLTGFVYHTPLGVLPFLLGLTVMLIIGLLTVGYQTLKAAFVNPSESLRME